MRADVSTEFVAAGCARGSGMMDWAPNGLLAYATLQDVCLASDVRSCFVRSNRYGQVLHYRE